MNLYLISQTIQKGWDTYDSAVVAAPDEETARRIHPSGEKMLPTEPSQYGSWAHDPADVQAVLLGESKPAIEQGVVLASFIAG